MFHLLTSPSMRQRIGDLLFWSVIAAAFIGPGTVATAAQAGASYGASLLWALWFSTVATLVLQEAAARLPLLTGLTLGQAIAQRLGGRRQPLVRRWLAGAVIFGCAAYQTGNLLGAMLGLRLIWPEIGTWVLLPLGACAGLLLWWGRIDRIAQGLGIMVALMGLMFLLVAWRTPLAGAALLRGSLWPALPQDSEWLVIALIGTTIVPYNLFLGSGLPHRQRLGDMRIGLAVAVVLGGIISVAILVVGTQVAGPFSMNGLSEAIGQRLGAGAKALFAWGLFAAGFTSATTAPLAAAITASGLLGQGEPTWQAQGRAFRWVWAGVLATGLAFGLLNLPPVPAIILAQAINGLLLPLVAVCLYLIINDRQLLSPTQRNPLWLNGLTLVVVAVALGLGLLSLSRVAAKVGGFALGEGLLDWLIAGATLATLALGLYAQRRGR
jgi:Mn2+/Fe2+ NRAMP family transporter